MYGHPSFIKQHAAIMKPEQEPAKSMLGYTPYQYLPLFAKIAIERLDADCDLRSNIMLDELLNSYAKTYGDQCDSQTRDSAHHICNRRFVSSFSILG